MVCGGGASHQLGRHASSIAFGRCGGSGEIGGQHEREGVHDALLVHEQLMRSCEAAYEALGTGKQLSRRVT